MTYEEFIEKVKKRAHDVFGYPLEDMVFYPKGYTSVKAEVRHWIVKANRFYDGRGEETLLVDILELKVPLADFYTRIRRLDARTMYERSEKEGFDTVFQDVTEGWRKSDEVGTNSLKKERPEGYYDLRRIH